MEKALILVDYIYDFVADDGALTCGKPAQDIKENIAGAIASLSANDFLIIVNDCHLDGAEGTSHPESKLFPPHAIKGTNGRDNVMENEIDESIANVIYLDKTRYSAFHKTGLMEILNENNIDKIYLAGVCTDICVLHTAVDAYNMDIDTTVLSSCVASFNMEGHNFALSHFTNTLGFKVIDKI